jgi:hypothetical protein
MQSVHTWSDHINCPWLTWNSGVIESGVEWYMRRLSQYMPTLRAQAPAKTCSNRNAGSLPAEQQTD